MKLGTLISESEFSKVFVHTASSDTKVQWIFYDKHTHTAQTISEAEAIRVLNCHAVQTKEGELS